MKNLDSNGVNSHIQMPKLMLKRFHNDNGTFYYYDVKGNYIGNKGRAGSTNTALGYYSIDVENYFRDNIETPMGNILSLIDEYSFSSELFVVDENFSKEVKKFIYSLLARSPLTLDQALGQGSFIKALSEQDQHGAVAVTGWNIACEQDIYSDYVVTFMVNRTETPFILSMDGIYHFKMDGYSFLNLNISPKLAISLVHESYAHKMIEGKTMRMFEILESQKVETLNNFCFSQQLNRKTGCVICPEKEELLRLKKVWVEEKTI